MINIGIGIPFGQRKIGGGSTNTARTQAFLTATGITDATIISALNAMDNSLISAGLLPSGTGAGKIKALYPIVGGTATTHKFNFVNPADTDAAFRLTFFGGWTHTANGMLPNGTNGYADTFLNSNTLGQNNFHNSIYSRTNSDGVFNDLAVWNSGFGISNYTKISGSYAMNSNSATINTVVVVNSLGFFGHSRTSSSQFIARAKGSTTTLIRNSSTPINANFIVSRTGNANAEYSNRQLALISIGDGLTSGEFSALETTCNTFQTTLGRAV